jgi:RNA polymerase-binding transcription factor DksA
MTDTNTFKKELEGERTRLVEELKKVGRVNPDNPSDWEATPGDTEHAADLSDEANQVEEYEERSAIETQLEEQLVNVDKALQKIDEGTFGLCTEGGIAHPIEEKRLEANPSAETCVAHMKG